MRSLSLALLLAAATSGAATVLVDEATVSGAAPIVNQVISAELTRSMWKTGTSTFAVGAQMTANCITGASTFTAQYYGRAPNYAVSLIPAGGDTAATTTLGLMIGTNQSASFLIRFWDTNENNATWNLSVTSGLRMYTRGLTDISTTLDWTSVNVISLSFGLTGGGSLSFPGDAVFMFNGSYVAPAVPESSTYGIALGGLALAGAAIRRRRKISK